MMTKLKTLLEGFAWERKEGKGLPTLAEVQAEYEKNEAVSQEEADKRWNDPIQMGMRNTSMPRNAVPASSMSTPQKAPNNFYREKITALEAQRKQLEFDMEQEAEPEGGPIRSDGMGAYTSTIYGVDDSGKKVKLTSLDDIAKFKTFGITEKEPRWQDNDGDGNWYEPGDDVKENVNESFVNRLKKNLIGGVTRK